MLDRARTLKNLRARLARNPKISKIGSEILRDPRYSLADKIAAIDALIRGEPKAIARWRARHSSRDEQTNRFGDRLLSAIARGEVPSLADVKTPEEAGTLLELARDPELIATFIMIYADGQGPNAAAVTRLLLDRVPTFTQAALTSAAVSIKYDNWARARNLAHEVFQRYGATPEAIEWPQTVAFFHTCVRRGRATEAADLVAELGLNDRWLPLYEALRIAGGDPDRLHRLAPEVRTPTIELLERLQRPGTKRKPGS